MIALFGDWIRKVALFVVFSTLIEMLMPESHFRKYIHMMMGLVLMLILIRPITAILLGNENAFENLIEINQLEMERQSILRKGNEIEAKQNELILDTYKSNLKEQISKLIESNSDVKMNYIEVVINEDKTDKEFGTIKEIRMAVIKEELSRSKVIGISPVKPIKIRTNDKEKQRRKEENEDENKDPELKKNIKNLLINFYNLSSDNIHITVQKKS